jgi:tetratricopeptide (TPR) repeat protein
MTTHIFLALGLWDDVVSQNEIALGPNADKYTPNHYSEWLAYGYLQQGRLADAARLQETFWRNVNNPMPEGQREGMVIVRATYVMNTGRWDDPSLSRTFTVSDLSPTAQAVEAFLRGYIAVAHKDNARAAAELAKLDALSHMKAADTDQPERDKVAILRNELRAVIRHAGGATEEAIGLLRETARIQDATPAEFGPPDVVKPVYELLGEMLMMKKGMAHEAERAFERSLELAPRRSASLLGLARASNLAGDRLAAAGAYADLASVWRHADAEVPGLAEARQSGGVGAIR